MTSLRVLKSSAGLGENGDGELEVEELQKILAEYRRGVEKYHADMMACGDARQGIICDGGVRQVGLRWRGGGTDAARPGLRAGPDLLPPVSNRHRAFFL